MAKRPDNWNQMSPEDQAIWDYLNAGDEFIAGGVPEFTIGDSLNYESLDPNQLAQIRGTSFDDLSTDPVLRNAQLDALRQLEEQAATGFTARDEADMAKLRADVNRTNRGRIGAIQQNMAARGMSGSGLDLVAQMQAAQDATEREALASLEQNAQMLDRKNQATMQRGQMAGAMRNQEFSEAARKAEARDAMNRFNTANQVNVQMQNNQGRNQVNAQNWNRANQTNDRNTQAGYDFRKDQLGVGQNNAQMAYNKAVEDYNRAQLKKQQKAAKRAGMMSGVLGAAGAVAGGVLGSGAGPMGTMAGASAGYQAGNALGGFAAGFARGGKVPGQAPFPGDHEMNDIFPAMLSPGEVVLPRTVADDPFEAAKFVADQNDLYDGDPMASKYIRQNAEQREKKVPFYPTPDGNPIPKTAPKVTVANSPAMSVKTGKPSPIPEPVLAKLAETQPDLVKQYRDRILAADKGVKDAEDMQGYLGIANLLGKAATDFANSQKQDVILKSRMQDLGNAPEVAKAERREYDGSMLDRIAAQGLARAEKDRAQAKEGFWEEQKVGELDFAQRLKDPNSPESQTAKEVLKSIFPKEQHSAIDRMSATQLDKYSPLFMDKLKMDAAERRYREEMALKQKLAAAKGPGEIKQHQALAAGYGKRLQQAELDMQRLAKSGYNRSDVSAGIGSSMPNIIKSKESQQQAQAERNFVNATLRRESGAAISASEFESAEKQYFPRAGDSPETLAQKARNRKQVMEAMKMEAGPAWELTPLVGNEKSGGGSKKQFDWED